MNVAFIVTSYWSYGELLIGIEFAKNIRKFGYNPYFFIPLSHEKILKESKIPYSLLLPRMGRVNRVLLQDYENSCKPGFVILSDFINYHFCERHYGITPEDLKIFSGKLGTIDIFDWGLEKRKMDTYGFSARTVSEVDIDNFGFKFLPCPITNPRLAENAPKDKFYYPLLEETIQWDEDLKLKLRRELNLPENKPILLLTSALWQETHKLYPHVTSFVAAGNTAFKNILKKIAKDATILYVGANDFFGEPETPKNVHILNRLAPEAFEKYAVASDLFITRNLTSTTMARLAMSGIPALTISNSVDFKADNKKDYTYNFALSPDTEKIMDQLEICYPYRMFPVGWHVYLEPVARNNPYMEVVPEVELFDEDGSVEKIRSFIGDTEARASIKQNLKKYNETLAGLKKPYQILDMLAEV